MLFGLISSLRLKTVRWQLSSENEVRVTMRNVLKIILAKGSDVLLFSYFLYFIFQEFSSTPTLKSNYFPENNRNLACKLIYTSVIRDVHMKSQREMKFHQPPRASWSPCGVSWRSSEWWCHQQIPHHLPLSFFSLNLITLSVKSLVPVSCLRRQHFKLSPKAVVHMSFTEQTIL